MTRKLILYQTRLAADVEPRMKWDNFEEKWLALTDSRRREIVLKGVCAAMRAGPGSHQERMFCPDSTVENLASKEGKTYLEYLRLLTAGDPSSPPVEPRSIPHPVVDRFLTVDAKQARQPGYKGYATFQRLMRNRCMSQIIANIFGAFVSKTTHLQIVDLTRGL